MGSTSAAVLGKGSCPERSHLSHMDGTSLLLLGAAGKWRSGRPGVDGNRHPVPEGRGDVVQLAFPRGRYWIVAPVGE